MFHIKKVIRKDSILNQYNLGILVSLYSPLNILNENVENFTREWNVLLLVNMLLLQY